MTVGDWTVELLELGRRVSRPSNLVAAPADDSPFDLAVNALLLRNDSLTILVDTGIGATSSILRTQTDLPRTLQQHGLTTADVDVVFLTHLDMDHVGGALEGSWPADLRPALSAQILVSSIEIEWASAGGGGAPFEAGAVAMPILGPYLVPVSGSAEIAPGVAARPAPGHTPGHTIIEVDGDPPLIYLADVVHARFLVEFPQPVLQDRDPNEGLRTRLALLNECADRGADVLATHIPGPSTGRIARLGGAYRWMPGSPAQSS